MAGAGANRTGGCVAVGGARLHRLLGWWLGLGFVSATSDSCWLVLSWIKPAGFFYEWQLPR